MSPATGGPRVTGVPASGKSHLAHALGAMAGCPVINSDAVRKEMAGLPPHAPGPETLYTPEAGRRTYRELGSRAGARVSDGDGVLVDATFRHRADREAFAGGWADAAPLIFVQCAAPADVLRRRAAKRDADPSEVSDATLEVVERERQRFEPPDEVATSRHLLVRTDREPDAVIADLLALLDLRLEGEPTGRDITSSGDATLPRRGPLRRPQSASAA